jgi:hypothetical protein
MTHTNRTKSLPERPRSIPWTLRLYILIGGAVSILAIVSVLAVLPVLAVMVPPSAPLFGPAYDRQADGQVTEIGDSNTEILNRKVIAIDATFRDAGGAEHHVRSYQTGSPPAVGARVVVHYQSADPERAVIDGMRTHALPWWLRPALYVFTVAAAAIYPMFGLRERRRALRLLARGAYTTGKVLTVESRGSGEDRTWHARIELTTAGQHVEQIVIRSPKEGELTVGTLEPLVYDPALPSGAKLLRLLPGKPVIEADERVHFG